MFISLRILLTIIFSLLALLHFHWAFGGKWGFDKALPTNEKGERVLNPRKIDSAIVGMGLSLFGLYYLFPFLPFNLPSWVINIVSWLIPTIFIFRAIGDFKYIGFFKKIKHTDFGKNDTRFYAPLCLLIGLMGLAIALF